MTRDYSKQRRDDERPSSRDQSSSRRGDERTPRRDRPRLNRETVDRAWESGAPSKHADYRTRSSYGEHPRNSWRNNRSSPAQNDSRPYGNRQDNNRRFERTPNSSQGPRARSFDADRRNFNDQRGNDRRGYFDNPDRNRDRPRFRDNPRQYEQRSQARDHDQSQDNRRRDSERSDRQPRSFERTNRSPHNADRSNRPSYPGQQRDTYNPRQQRRPRAQYSDSFRGQQNSNGRAPQNEQFEGDYERFNSSRYQRRAPARPVQPRGNKPYKSRPEPEEPHVTPAPGGRVLKGPRPAQRRNAEFWTEVEKETESLTSGVEAAPADKPIDRVDAKQVPGSPAKDEESLENKDTAKTQSKPRSRAASAIARRKKAGPSKRSSTGPKPSQRGFKWPAP